MQVAKTSQAYNPKTCCHNYTTLNRADERDLTLEKSESRYKRGKPPKSTVDHLPHYSCCLQTALIAHHSQHSKPGQNFTFRSSLQKQQQIKLCSSEPLRPTKYSIKQKTTAFLQNTFYCRWLTQRSPMVT
jgi:hypothetical protein